MVMTPYEEFIAVSRYARWVPKLNRREHWPETVRRYIDFFREHLQSFGMDADDPIFDVVERTIVNRDVMPSMRALMTAGPALKRSHMAGYNCSFVSVDHPRAFDEIMFILMNGTGVGFSVDRKSIDRLPQVPDFIVKDADTTILVQDSREGWANAFRQLIAHLYMGRIPLWDVSLVRPHGARLQTFGGRASGPGPLLQLFDFTVQIFKGAEGRQLTSLEVHDLVCKIGDVVVSGGVRRSALISLSDLSDFEMAKAKSGNWWEDNGQRALANNSAIYDKKPTPELFLREWCNLIESKSGERGIFNREGVRNNVPERRDGSQIAGTNPCGEISLRSMGLCNLTEVVLKPNDSEAQIEMKVSIAALIGTWQSTLTDFKYVRPEWRANAEDERLLGVSLTGIYGHPMFNDVDDPWLPARLEGLRSVAVSTNRIWAQTLGIKVSASVTTVKPSGTVSQLTGVSSGIHPWHSQQYIRTVRGANSDPLTQLMIHSGVPNEPDLMNPEKTTVFSFPIAAPPAAVTRDQVTAIEHLRMYAIYRKHWAEHQVSITVTVKPEEWVSVAAWVYENWDIVAGVSFLPYTEHTYKQAPYTECDEETLALLIEAFPSEVRFADLVFYESEDGTSGARELACTSDNGCEVVDLVEG